MCKFVLESGDVCKRVSNQEYCYQHYHHHIALLESEISELRKSNADYKQECAVLKACCFDYIDKRDDANNKVSELTKKLEKVENENGEIYKQLESFKQDVQFLNNRNDNLKKRNQSLMSSRDKTLNELERLNKLVEGLNLKNNEYLNRINNQTVSINKLKVNANKYNVIVKFEYIRNELCRLANTQDYLCLMNFCANPANINVMISLFGHTSDYKYHHLYDDMRQERNLLCHPYMM